MTSTPVSPPQTVDYLLSAPAVRDRCRPLFAAACAGQLDHFRCDLAQISAAAAYVDQVMARQYPDGAIPVHSRWRHFEVDGASRLALFEPALGQLSALERARLQGDLVIVSVLLDAGAGPHWRYVEPTSGRVFSRSEGLALASIHAFREGLFSSDPDRPWQADALGLSQLTEADLAAAFQVSMTNPLVGLGGRVALLNTLGQVLQQQPGYFGSPGGVAGNEAMPRPGHLMDHWLGIAREGQLSAPQVLRTLLHSLGPIWPGRTQLGGVNLGDVWPHPYLANTGPGTSLVPFHKLSQWLAYSLLEPLAELGLMLTDLDGLTGLPEYRNGGLLVDLGVLVPCHDGVTTQAHAPGSAVIVEWRALTVIALDHLATALRPMRGATPTSLPLAQILQGGTWTAGRQVARDRRPGGGPPIQIVSDGTVF